MEEQDVARVLGAGDALAGFSRLSISLVLTDPRQDDNPIIYVNDAFERTTGYSRSAAVGRNCRFLQGEHTDKRDVDRIRAAVETARDVSVDILNYRANGEPFYNRVIIAPIMGDDGEPLFFFGIQKELVDSDRGADNRISEDHLGQLQNLVQNDLALVLQRIGRHQDLSAGVPALEIAGLPRRLEGLQLVYEEMRHASRNRNRLMLDLGSLLSRLSSAIAHDEAGPGIRFVQSVEGTEVSLERATRIALVVSEVLHNAFRHAFSAGEDGTVELRATRLAGGAVRLVVSDDGQGLPKGLDWPNRRSTGGRIVMDMLQGLDASLFVSRGAAGTTVTIDIPVDLDAAA